MILKSVKLENIRSYLNQEINFPDGSVLLSGDIGSGKSTILLAVEFALFGFAGKSLSGRTLLRHGKNQGSVELGFSLDRKEIIIKRALKRVRNGIQQSSGYIIVNGIKKEATAIELKAEIINLLGYPGEMITKSNNLVYRYTVYTPQEEMRQILYEDEEVRQDILRKVFGIDKYKKIRLNCYIYTKQLKQKEEELNERISDFDEKKKEIDNKKEELKGLKKELDILLPLFEDIKQKISIKKGWVDKYEQDVKKLNSLKNQLEVNEAKLIEKINQNSKNKNDIEILEKDISELKEKIGAIKFGIDLDKKEKELNELVENKTKYEQQLQSLTEAILALENEIKEKNEFVKNLDKKLILFSNLRNEIAQKDVLEKNVKEIEALINEINKELNSFETKKKSSLDVKEQIEKLDNCPTCLQKVPDFHKKTVYESENKKMMGYENEIDKLTKKRDSSLKESEGIKKIFEDVLNKANKSKVLDAEIKNLRIVSNEILKKEEKLKESMLKKEEIVAKTERFDIKKIDLMKKELNELRELKHLSDLLKDKQNRMLEIIKVQENIKKEIGGINIQKIRLRQDIEKLADAEKEFSDIRKEFEELKEKEKEVLVRKTGFEKESEGVEKIINILDKEIKEKLVIKEKIRNIGKYKEWLERYFMSLMNNIEKHVMANVYSEFNELFQQWFNILIEDETINVRLDNNFTPVIEQNGYESFVDNLSGGEKTAAALAYRLALNKVINSMMGEIRTKDIIILDEPTDGFSSEQLDRVRDVLDEIGTKQTIIVSHESKIESFVDNVVRVRKNEHVSGII